MRRDNKKITRGDFSVQKVRVDEKDIYLAYAHFAPFHFGDVQQGRHKFYQATAFDKEEAISILIRAVIKDLEELCSK